MAAYTRLVLLAPEGMPISDLLSKLQSAFAGGPVDAVILSIGPGEDRARTNYVKSVAELVQSQNSVLLIDGAFEIVARAGADGVHLSSPKDLDAALDRDPQHERMIGVGGVRTRHEAMEIAEAGADYVMFGEPRPDGFVPPLEKTLDFTAWWAELFNTPGIGFASKIGEVGMIASTGIEFVALGSAVFDHPEGPTMAVRMAHDQISHAPVPPWAEATFGGSKA